MPFFVLQVRTGGEERFRRQAEKVLTPERGELFWPRRSLRVLQQFRSFGEVVQPSRARFDSERRIQVIDGPLKALEGRIVRVDRRKRRARVRLELYENSFLIDFGFEDITPHNP